MKKKILIGVAVVIAIIIVVLVVGISNIGALIKTAVNTYGPGITKTNVRLEGAGVSIFSGEAKLKGFHLGNPRGFTSPEAIRVASVFVNLDEKSLAKGTIVIDKIEVVRPEITYEKALGTDNFKTILDNVKGTAGAGAAPKGKTEEGGEGKKLLIRDFVVKDGKVTLATSLLGGQSISAPLPDIRLQNIGGEKEGASPAEVFKDILTALYAKITSPDVTNVLNEELKKLGTSLEAVGEEAKKQLETVGKGAKEELGGVTDRVKGLFGK